MDKIIIDVRDPDEYAQGHFEGALNIPPRRLEEEDVPALQNIPKDTPIIVYCRSGSRSNIAAYILKEQGFTNITNGINKDHVVKLLSERAD